MKDTKCSCGVASANAFVEFDFAVMELKKENPNISKIMEHLRWINSYLSDMERECKVDLKDAEQLLEKVRENIRNSDWKEARLNLSDARFRAWRTLLRCTRRERGLPWDYLSL